ncbi:hypothetical protein H0H93_014706 [Arthromyces matolae]|nr:hypothetical protein H0H93_014706 [Arthromyces matolae]
MGTHILYLFQQHIVKMAYPGYKTLVERISPLTKHFFKFISKSTVIMKFILPFTAAAFGLLFSSAAAQQVQILYPPNGASVARGAQVPIQIGQPNGQSSWVNVAIALAITSCANSCYPVETSLGSTFLLKALYDPANGSAGVDSNGYYVPNYQNATITIPSNIDLGPAQLGLAFFVIVGASMDPMVASYNLTLNIVDAPSSSNDATAGDQRPTTRSHGRLARLRF